MVLLLVKSTKKNLVTSLVRKETNSPRSTAAASITNTDEWQITIDDGSRQVLICFRDQFPGTQLCGCGFAKLNLCRTDSDKIKNTRT